LELLRRGRQRERHMRKTHTHTHTHTYTHTQHYSVRRLSSARGKNEDASHFFTGEPTYVFSFSLFFCDRTNTHTHTHTHTHSHTHTHTHTGERRDCAALCGR
jgi:ABC-type oligopeptide transport system ATPase subunit